MTNADIEVGWRTQTSSETRPWSWDLTAEMDTNDVIANATSELTDLLTGASFPTGLVGGAATSLSVPHVVQAVTGLVPGHNYRLVVTIEMGGSKKTATVVKLTCPY